MKENIAWMDKHDRVHRNNDDDLEDRIVSAIEALPSCFESN